MSEDQVQYKGEYKFDENKFWNLNSGTTMEELPKEPIDDEQLLQQKLKEWKDSLINATDAFLKAEDVVIECKNKIKYFEQAIKSYNKAFKK